MVHHVAFQGFLDLKAILDPGLADDVVQDSNEQAADERVIDVFREFARQVGGQAGAAAAPCGVAKTKS